jgi:hypothetical protein
VFDVTRSAGDAGPKRAPSASPRTGRAALQNALGGVGIEADGLRHRREPFDYDQEEASP